jgi:hypothetical protein
VKEGFGNIRDGQCRRGNDDRGIAANLPARERRPDRDRPEFAYPLAGE